MFKLQLLIDYLVFTLVLNALCKLCAFAHHVKYLHALVLPYALASIH